MLRQGVSGLFSLLFPVLCRGCGTSLTDASRILCSRCKAGLPRTRFEHSIHNPVMQAFWGRVPLEFAASLFYYRKGELLPHLIHQLKYKKHRENGLFLGTLAGNLIKASGYYAGVEAIVPVPLHPKKEQLRGYNQSVLLSEGIASATGLPVFHHELLRLKHTQSQTRRGRYERWENVEGIFGVARYHTLANRHLLVVDDVVTTGSTLEACCHALLQVPGVKLSVLTVGYAVG